MDAVLAGLKYQFCLVYVDDIIVYSDTFEEHMTHISRVLERIVGAGLRIKLEKCHFAQSELKFLGKIVNGRGVAVDPAKVDGIQAIGVPKSVSDVQTFLGMCVFHHKHIENYGTIARPLYELTKQDVEWRWTAEEQDAFEKLKTAIKEAAILEFPEKDIPMVLSVDASKRGLGGAVYKIKDNTRIPMAFLSKSLTDPKTRYSNTEREGLAVVWAIQTLDSYLWGNNFTVESDHLPLLPLRKKCDLSGKWACWSYALADYNFKMKLADDIPQQQQRDKDFAAVHHFLVNGTLDGTKEQQDNIRKTAHRLILLEDTLYQIHRFDKTGF
ncbi:hypothetical protein PhCBS80983_g06379 [Powellomyces hirtus]|uniref:Reverse transcriptase domain-containing protein n=1 Tax=Powellomyces hirtus TaxID=109895 RepID=A0A507DND2_9FUNG|nr:hypothetical protein PhCBS80983_g06379 [Powellomyces hirtus]